MKLTIRTLLLVFLLAACSKDETPTLSSDAKLLSFSIQEITESFSISSNKVETTLKDERDLKNLTAVFSISPDAKVFVGNTLQTSGYSKNDFTNPVTYIVEAEDGTRTSYTVSINFEAKLTAFSIKELNNVNFTIDNLSITATVPAGTDLSNLTAEFTTTQNSSLYIGGTLQESGKTTNNFEQSVTYDLKQNNETAKQYTVTISEAPNNQPVANAGENKVAVLVGSNTSVTVRLDGSNSSDVEAPIAAFEWKLNGSTIGNTEVLDVDLNLGTHNVELIVTDSYGDTDSDAISIEVRVQGTYLPIDSNATQETKNLYTKLATLANGSQFAFGQEFPLTFQLNSMSTDLNTSDCKDVTGDHPGVYGIDPHYMLYKPESQKQLHIDEAKHAYNNGSIVTFDFHQRSRTDHKVYFNGITTDTDKSLMYDIVNDLNDSRTWFYTELDEVLDIINNDLGFPIVFRLFHEMNGAWFWWGTQATNHSAQLYIDFYQLAVDYIKDRTNLVLFGWTPNQTTDESYYPGDTYVDVVGIDYYNPVKSNLKAELTSLSTFAFNHDKVAIFSETGKEDYVNLTPTFWTSNVLAAIQEGGSDIRIAWVLAWFNAPWNSSQSQLYIPNANSSTQIKNDFINFYNSPSTLFQQEVNALNVYNQ
ncbi:glycosyl hydrolase [Seonamhaeicola sp.]|uniref:glycosyl hydrolase n=1 Tax=Seonamhaeicola sp. TaxID=1912245 RepID=UPI00261C00A7|nr:glycosyl hydrolase [Seonamhaeicola sp.]